MKKTMAFSFLLLFTLAIVSPSMAQVTPQEPVKTEKKCDKKKKCDKEAKKECKKECSEKKCCDKKKEEKKG